MNLRISLALLSAVVATAAYANRATNKNFAPGDAGYILGTGSLAGDDTRNMFYNPAYVNNSKNWAVIEKSSDNTSGAEGGFVTSMMNFNLGVYMGRDLQGDLMRTSTGTGSTVTGSTVGYVTDPVRSFEVLGGMDLGTAKIGLGVSHASISSIAAGTTSDVNVNVGASIMGFEPFAGFKVVGKDPGAAGGTNAKHNAMRFGVRYVYGEWVPFAAIKIAKDVINPGTSEWEQTNWGLGIARNTKLAEGVKLGYSIAYFRGEDKDKIATTSKVKRQTIPIGVSAEADATSWLTVRAGVDYRLMDKTDSASAGENTTGRIGAGFHFGKADLDFVAGSSAGTENFDGKTFDLSNGLFSAASLTYHW